MGWYLYGLTLGLIPLVLFAWHRELEGRPVIVWRLVGRWSALRRWLVVNYVPLIFLGAILILLWAAAIGLWRVPFVVDALLDNLLRARTPEATRSAVTALAAVLAAIAIFGTIIVQSIRVWTNERQLSTIEQGHVTDRITKAVDQLGAEKTVKRLMTDADGKTSTQETTEPNLEVRLGGIYALERIAQDSERDHVPIMEILCAYIRQNAKAELKGEQITQAPNDFDENSGGTDSKASYVTHSAWVARLPALRTDVQAALTVISRRGTDRIAIEKTANFTLNLSGTNLRKANLRKARLAGADLGRTQLQGASMSGAWLKDAYLERACLIGADLTEGYLEHANLRGADLLESNLRGAILEFADLQYANLHYANLEGARLLRANLEYVKMGIIPTMEHDSRHWLERLLWRSNKFLIQKAFLMDLMADKALRLEGADLREVNFRMSKDSDWTGVQVRASLAHSADFRCREFTSGIEITQSQLDQMLGNRFTLLPLACAVDTGQPYRIMDRWASEPEGWSTLVHNLSRFGRSEQDLRYELLCPPGTTPKETGLRLPFDAPYPEGHPLAQRV